MKKLDHKWDIYFMRIAKEVSKNSKCMSRHIGAILVKDKCVVSTGYNGPSRGTKHCNERPSEFYTRLDGRPSFDKGSYYDKCPRRMLGYKSGEGLHLCQAGHAERNALIQAARLGISTKGASLYCYCGRPCKDCSIEIVNAGIKEIICIDNSTNSGEYDKYSKTILKEGRIQIRKIGEEEL